MGLTYNLFVRISPYTGVGAPTFNSLFVLIRIFRLQGTET